MPAYIVTEKESGKIITQEIWCDSAQAAIAEMRRRNPDAPKMRAVETEASKQRRTGGNHGRCRDCGAYGPRDLRDRGFNCDCAT